MGQGDAKWNEMANRLMIALITLMLLGQEP